MTDRSHHGGSNNLTQVDQNTGNGSSRRHYNNMG